MQCQITSKANGGEQRQTIHALLAFLAMFTPKNDNNNRNSGESPRECCHKTSRNLHCWFRNSRETKQEIHRKSCPKTSRNLHCGFTNPNLHGQFSTPRKSAAPLQIPGDGFNLHKSAQICINLDGNPAVTGFSSRVLMLLAPATVASPTSGMSHSCHL